MVCSQGRVYEALSKHYNMKSLTKMVLAKKLNDIPMSIGFPFTQNDTRVIGGRGVVVICIVTENKVLLLCFMVMKVHVM